MTRFFYNLLLSALTIGCLSAVAYGANVDRVIAYIESTAITYRELLASHAEDVQVFPERSRRETLDAMINTELMLRDARLLRLRAREESELLRKYLDLKVRAVVLVSEKDISMYYSQHRSEFSNRKLSEVKARIRTFLEERQYNITLEAHIESLREKSHIRVLLED